MSIVSLDRRYSRQECDNRRRRAALRDSVEAAPLLLLRDQSLLLRRPPGRLKFSSGGLPIHDAAAVERINDRLAAAGGEDEALSVDDVFIHYAEAANNRFIGDRFMFLHETTLRNIAAGAEHGFAFMNSHRTGGLSEPTELPFGRTFSGRYEEHELDDGSTFRRALVGVYMVKGVHPNGKNGPSTDDLSAGIVGGTLTDVSMGLSGGFRVCDVCGEDLEARDDKGRYRCPHAPGTDEDMEEEHIEAQKARGVAKGYASYSLLDAYPQEVSAVFKGAVPGAGFRKSLALAAADPKFAARRGREVISAYGPMLTHHERLQFGGERKMGLDLMKLLRGWDSAGKPELEGVELAIVTPPAEPPGREVAPRSEPGRFTRLQVDEPIGSSPPDPMTERERRVILREAAFDARVYLGTMAGKLSPFEMNNLGMLYMLAALDDAERPAVSPVDGKPVKRVDLLKAANEHRGPVALMPKGGEGSTGGDLVGDTPLLNPGERTLSPAPEAPDPKAVSREKTFELLAGSPSGRVVLQETEEGRAYLQRYDKARRF
jgi:hypothetical protein